MSTPLTLHLPASLHRQLSALAEEEGVSIEQLLMLVAAEKMAALHMAEIFSPGALPQPKDVWWPTAMRQAWELFEREAALASQAELKRVLAKVPDVEPEAHDRLP